VSSADAGLRAKTTARALYDAARAGAPPRAAEVLLLNERAEATEFTVGNAVSSSPTSAGTRAEEAALRVAGDVVLVTPPLHCGLLAGVLREHALLALAGGCWRGRPSATAASPSTQAEAAEGGALESEPLIAALDAGDSHAGFDALPPDAAALGGAAGGSVALREAVVSAAQIRARTRPRAGW